MACGLEGSLAVFCVGAIFLSLEVFELPYLLMMLSMQLPVALRASQTIPMADLKPATAAVRAPAHAVGLAVRPSRSGRLTQSLSDSGPVPLTANSR
jgi:hypothetical protein